MFYVVICFEVAVFALLKLSPTTEYLCLGLGASFGCGKFWTFHLNVLSFAMMLRSILSPFCIEVSIEVFLF